MNYKVQRLPKLTNLKYEVWEQKTCSKSTQKSSEATVLHFLHFRKYLTVFVKLDIFSVVYILASGRRNYELNVKGIFATMSCWGDGAAGTYGN